MANNIFVYWSDGLGAGHLTIIVGTGGGVFANKNCPEGRAIGNFFQVPGVCPGVCREGMLAAGIDLHISHVIETSLQQPCRLQLALAIT